ncbi:MAG: hypothetical protein ACR2F6_04755 [Mycobacteriales bacterium]
MSGPMGKIVLYIIIGWIVVAVIGFVVHSLLWLGILAIVGLAVTAALGGFSGNRKSIR